MEGPDGDSEGAFAAVDQKIISFRRKGDWTGMAQYCNETVRSLQKAARSDANETRLMMVVMLSHLSFAYSLLGEPKKAAAAKSRSLRALLKVPHSPRDLNSSHRWIGRELADSGDFDRAYDAYLKSIRCMLAITQAVVVCESLSEMADMERLRGNAVEAEALRNLGTTLFQGKRGDFMDHRRVRLEREE